MTTVTEREGIARLTRVARPTESGGLMPPLARRPRKRAPATSGTGLPPANRRRPADPKARQSIEQAAQGIPAGDGTVRDRA